MRKVTGNGGRKRNHGKKETQRGRSGEEGRVKVRENGSE